MVSSLMNDTAQQKYNNESCLPYLNMALDELQEIMEENNIPVTNQTSASLTIPIGTPPVTEIAFIGTTPVLPPQLIELQEVWESDLSQDNWFPLARKEFIPHNIEGIELNTFGIFVWKKNILTLPTVNNSRNLKLDYIESIFITPIAMGDIETDLGVQFKNIKTYLGYATGALCSMFIGENETRAAALNGKAEEALERTLNIPTKGRQAIYTRRRPFRQAYKSRGWY